MDNIPVKLVFDDDIRRFRISENVDYNQLFEVLFQMYPEINFSVSYFHNKHNKLLIVRNENDLKEAIELAKENSPKILRIFLESTENNNNNNNNNDDDDVFPARPNDFPWVSLIEIDEKMKYIQKKKRKLGEEYIIAGKVEKERLPAYIITFEKDDSSLLRKNIDDEKNSYFSKESSCVFIMSVLEDIARRSSFDRKKVVFNSSYLELLKFPLDYYIESTASKYIDQYHYGDTKNLFVENSPDGSDGSDNSNDIDKEKNSKSGVKTVDKKSSYVSCLENNSEYITKKRGIHYICGE